MEHTWLETIQFIGLDLMVVAIVLALAGAGLTRLARAALRALGQRARRRPRAAPTRPLDAWPPQGWGTSR